MKMLAKKGLALLLAIVMVVGFVPNLGVFASAEETTVTVTYKSEGTVLSTEEVAAGGTVTLPEYTGTAPDGYTFEGWLDAVVNHATAEPTLLEPNTEYTADADTTIYAVFSYTEEVVGGSGGWVRVTDASTLAAGDKLVMAVYATSKSKAFAAGALSSGYLASVEVTMSADYSTIETLPDSVKVFTLGGSAGAWTLTDTDGNNLYCTAVKKVALGSSTATAAKWSISISDNEATIQNGTSSYGRFLYNVNSPRFTTYTSNTSTSMLLPWLYREEAASGSKEYYTTHSCTHDNAAETAAVAPGCTEVGYEAGVYCADCDTYLSGHGVVAATGHDYEGEITPPSTTSAGYTTYTCSVCGDSYTGDEVPPLTVAYTVTFSVPEGVDAVESQQGNNTDITLPEAGVPKTKYTFLGWVADELDNETAAPAAIYAAGDTYTVTGDVTLYALYTYSEGGTGETAYQLVTDAAQLAAGKKVIIAAAGYDKALSTTQNTNNRGVSAITKDAASSTLTPADDTALLTLGEGTVDNTYSFYCAAQEGYLYAASSSGNQLKTGNLNDNASWLITVNDDGSCSVVAQGTSTRNYMMYNATSSLFACYAASNTQKPVALYVEGISGTKYYTTVTEHVHTYAEGETVCACGVVTAAIGDVEYTELTVALAAAETTDTVKLLADVVVEGDVDIYCTLDLAGNTLTASGVVDAANDYASITDSVGAGTAAGSSVVMMPANGQLAIDAANNGVYSYETVELKQKKTVVDEDNTTVKFIIDKEDRSTLLDDAILAGSDVKVRITVTSDAITGGSHSFVFGQDLVGQYAADWNNKMFTCAISGLSELGEYTITADVMSGGVVVEAITVA